VKGITGESFIPESLILPQGIPALCDDPGLRTVILAMLPTFDESGVAVRQTDDRNPHHGIRISDAPAGGPQSAGVAPSAPITPPAPWTRARGLQAVPPPQVASGGRRKRCGTDCSAPTGHSSWTPQKRQRTAGGAKEAGSQAQGAQRRVSPLPPPPSGPPPPQPPPPSGPPPPPPPGGDLLQGHQQQQQQQQQQKQRSTRFQGRWKVQGPK
jgi:hypothetical protein